MNLVLVICHPDNHSFTFAVARKVAESAEAHGVAVQQHNLYGDNFNPVLSRVDIARRYSMDPLVRQYTKDVSSADHIVFVHPEWWSGPPALLKGWVDRVFAPGVAYDWAGEEFTAKKHTPMLNGKMASVFVSTEREEGDEPETVRSFWEDACSYSGLDLRGVRVFHDVRDSSIGARRHWLDDVAADIDAMVLGGN